MFLDSSAKMKPDFLVYTLSFGREQGVLTCSRAQENMASILFCNMLSLYL